MGSGSIPDYSWIDDVGGSSDGELRWALDGLQELPPPPSGLDGHGVYADVCCLDQTENRKRSRNNSCRATKSKACREKMRRDRLNDRFLELSAIIDPGRPPRSDKSSILGDAANALLQLRKEAQELKEANEKLQDTVKDLKAEKNELRDEKLKLKEDKDRLEQQLKMMSIPPAGFMSPHPAAAAFHAAATFAAQAATNKASTYTAYPSLPTWQWLPHGSWLPPASRDITDDPKQVSPTA